MSELKPFEYKYDGTYKLKRKAVIFYVSLTGNTEKIANVMKEQIEAEGWEVTLAKVQKDTRITKPPREYYLDDYDLVLLGSPVFGGLPSPWFANNFGLIGSEPPGFYHINDYGIFVATEVEKPYGAAFVTYSGTESGPQDCAAALEAIKMYLDVMGCSVVGRMGVPGKGTPRSIGAAAPEGEIKNYGGHYDLDNRPNEDDCTKAKIWVKDMIRDLFTEDGRRLFGGEYVTIS